MHEPFVHWLPPEQTWPHVPQLPLLVLVSLQTPPHSSSPAPHTHVPPLHAVPPMQTLPQPPQLRLSQHFDTQPPLHSGFPGGHWGTHWPEEQTFFGGHATPHAPQLDALESRLTQYPSQRVLPAGHTHLPPEQ